MNNYIEEALNKFFGCDPAYYPKEEVEDIRKALEQGFLAGYAAAENKIREQIQKLEKELEVNYTSLTLTEQIRKVADIKMVKTKIEALKELLN